MIDIVLPSKLSQFSINLAAREGDASETSHPEVILCVEGCQLRFYFVSYETLAPRIERADETYEWKRQAATGVVGEWELETL